MTEPNEAARQRGRATLAISCVATLLVLVNYTAPISTVGVISAQLRASPAGSTWILGSISLGLAAFLLVAGALADGYGRRRVFCYGGALLVLSSILCALAPDTLVFVVGRVVQGGASAAILAASLGLLGHVFPPGPARARATGLWGAMVGGGIAIGPLLTSGLIRVTGWPLAYWLIALVAAALTVWGAVGLGESRSPNRRRLDLPGVLTLGAGIAFLVAALTQGRSGWGQPDVIVFLVIAVLLLAGFIVVEARGSAPMLDLGLLRRPAFVAATVGAFATGVSVIAFMTYVPTEAQRVLGLSPLGSAGLLAVWSGLSFVVAPQARRLVHVIGPRHQIALGLAVCGIGEIAAVGISPASSWWQFVPGLAIAGIGSGFVNAALAGLAVHSVPADRVAMGSGANNTARYLGSSVGVALLAAIVALAPAQHGAAAAFGTGMTYAALTAGVLAILGALLVLLCRERPESVTAEGAVPGAKAYRAV